MQADPGAAFEVVEARFLLQLLVGLLADPAGLDGSGELLERRIGGKVGEMVLRSPVERCSPTTRTSSPGRCRAPLSWMRWAGPSATRTRTAAKRADRRPLVPRRQLTVRHRAASSIARAVIDFASGRGYRRGRPRCRPTGRPSVACSGSNPDRPSNEKSGPLNVATETTASFGDVSAFFTVSESPPSAGNDGFPWLWAWLNRDGSPAGGNWWARLDSNQQPDRYERPALTN